MKSNVYRLMCFGLAAVIAFAATAADPAKEKKYVDPNEFASYSPGTASKAGDPSAAEWQKANEAAIKAATSPEALKEHLKDAAAAKALLAKVKGAYASAPMVLTVAAAISQHVMQPDDCGWLCAIGRTLAFWRTDERDVWTEALLDTATKSSDVYVQMFCLDQLRWCGLAKQAAAVRTFGEVASDKAVKDFAAWVAHEMEK